MSERTIPEPPRGAIQRATDLRAATVSYCRDEYIPARWWPWSEHDRARYDYPRFFASWERAQPLEQDAQKVLGRVQAALQAAERLLDEHPQITNGGPAAVMLRALTARSRELQNDPPEADYPAPVTLRVWFRWEGIERQFEPVKVRDYTVLAVAAGYWRDNIPGRKSVAWALRELDKTVRKQIEETEVERAAFGPIRELLKL